jgi:hypothetical protein
MKKVLLTVITLSGITSFSFAQTAGQVLGSASSGQALLNLFSLVQIVINFVTPYLVGIAALLSLYCAFVYLYLGRRSESKRQDAQAALVKIFIALCTIVAVWGAVGFIATIVAAKA